MCRKIKLKNSPTKIFLYEKKNIKKKTAVDHKDQNLQDDGKFINRQKELIKGKAAIDKKQNII